MNLQRAIWADIALDAFRNEAGLDTFEDTVTDLVADIGHLCDSKGKDFVALMAKAIGDWKLEQTDPESIETRPHVSIEVAS